jgi:hypothetical protein
MEPRARTPSGAHRLRRLNVPAPIEVRGEGGVPGRVRLGGRWRGVAHVDEVWRIDDGWWRPDPVARTYFRLALEDGRVVTVYRDDAEGTWWAQRY